MEESEPPIEKIQEDLHERAQEELEHHGSSFSAKIALTSAILAVFAAIASLLAGHHSNEAMILQIQASDSWSYYQAKGIKNSLLVSKMELLQQLGKPADSKDAEKLKDYKKEQEDISEQAKEREKESQYHLAVHQVLARAVTFFQIAITLAAISVLTRRKKFWGVSLLFGAVGLINLLLSFFAK